jgi:hypothetical protein
MGGRIFAKIPIFIYDYGEILQQFVKVLCTHFAGKTCTQLVLRVAWR